MPLNKETKPIILLSEKIKYTKKVNEDRPCYSMSAMFVNFTDTSINHRGKWLEIKTRLVIFFSFYHRSKFKFHLWHWLHESNNSGNFLLFLSWFLQHPTIFITLIVFSDEFFLYTGLGGVLVKAMAWGIVVSEF